jgi:hypothetical protein
MVTAAIARLDADNLFFNGTKVALYHVESTTEDLTYGSMALSYTTYRLPIQGNVTSLSEKFPRQGILPEGVAVGVLRYEYTEDADGVAISPTLHPKTDDELTFMGTRYRINKLSPQMSEDHNIILYTFEAVPVRSDADLNFPLTFPIAI